ncbi:MAG: malto-oligosyltrehalose trehalohydrolase [Aquabacterium sp.]|nr:malto-oligosyltrehalose trehalohydrolase [Aquabacterium sp.]
MSLLSPDRPSARTSSDTAAADRAASGTAASLHFAHAMPFGACLRPEGGVRFRLWAPDAQQASVWVDDAQAADDQVIPARRLEGGWFEAEAPQVAAGACYRWRVDDKLDVPDPASRFNPEGPHGPSRVVDPMAFTWGDAERTWTGRPWHEAVMLELHVGTFTPEGTYAAAMARLPALAESGITAIQLMPLADFPGRFGWGYDGVLPYAPHEAYGEPDDLKRFVQEAHRLGLMVLLDVVYNHFGPDGNYLHAYASRFFTERHHTAWGAAINFDQPGCEVVREFFVHNALYWLLEYRFDGLRFDAVHAMLDDSRPDIMETLSRRIREACPGRHVHLVLENDSNDVDRLGPPGTPGRFEGQWSGDFHHTLHVLLTGERDGYYAEYASPDGADRGEPLRQLAQVLTDGFAWQGGPHNSEGAAPRRRATQRAPLSATVNFLQNHDQIGNRAFGERLIRLAHPRALELATTLLLLGPSPVLLFMGEPDGADTPFLYFANWSGDLRQAVTEGRRKEFAHFPAFADAATRERIPDPCDAATLEASRLDWLALAQPAARQWARLHRDLLKLRHREITPRLPQLQGGGHEAQVIGNQGLYVRWAFADRWLEFTGNLSDEPVTIARHADVRSGEVIAVIHMSGDASLDDRAAGRFTPWSSCWRWLHRGADAPPASSTAGAGEAH